MRFGSVCSWIEAASVAWHPLGWQAAWFSEIEPFPCAVLAHHYPDVPNLGDMTTIARRVITTEHAAALSAAIVDHGGAIELRMADLSDDEREALDRLVVWLDHAEACGR